MSNIIFIIGQLITPKLIMFSNLGEIIRWFDELYPLCFQFVCPLREQSALANKAKVSHRPRKTHRSLPFDY